MPNQNASNKGLITTFYVASLIFAIFSGYQTFRGYESTLTKVWAIALGFIAALFLFYLTVEFISRRVYGHKSTTPIILALCIIIFISFPANFNSLYNFFTKEKGNLSELAINSAWTTFDQNIKKSKEALSKIPDANLIQNKFSQIENERNNLRTQITDMHNPGLGKKAKDHLKRIEALLGQDITSLQPPKTGSSANEFQMYADNLDDLIRKIIDTKFQKDEDKYSKIIAEINTKHKLYSDNIQNKPTDTSIIIDLARTSKEIENSLKAIGVPIEFDTIHTEPAKTGEIPSTFVTAYMEMPQPMTTLFVTVISLMIDILVPILGVLIFSPGDELNSKNRKSNQPNIIRGS
jgi:hypothetical protein